MAIFVYAAGGVSARFDGKIKGLTPVGPNNETLLEISMEQAIQAGCTEFIFIVGKKSAHEIQAFLGMNISKSPFDMQCKRSTKRNEISHGVPQMLLLLPNR